MFSFIERPKASNKKSYLYCNFCPLFVVSMKNTSLFSVDESNFNLASPSSPPPMIFLEEEEEEEDNVYDDYDGAVLFIEYGDDDDGGVYYNQSPKDVVDDYSSDVRLIVGLQVMSIEEGSSLLLGGVCVVCLEDFRVGWHAKLPCSHIFHQNCLLPLLRMNDLCAFYRHKMA